MKRIACLTAAAGGILYMACALGQTDGVASPIYGVKIPAGYRDWRLISVKRLAGNMVKDSKKYAASGGWGYADFTNGKPGDQALHEKCFPCHAPEKDHDYIFTRYAPTP